MAVIGYLGTSAEEGLIFQVSSEIQEAIEKWEPRAKFVNVVFEGDVSQPGTLWPTVEVEIIGT